MKSKIKILWISRFAPISTATSGGSQTFNYYFKQFLEDERFDIRLISCGQYKEQDIVENETAYIPHEIIYWGNPNQKRIIKTLNMESKFNPWNRYAGLISNTEDLVIKKTVLQYKEEGFFPDVTILEWTNMVMYAGILKKMFPFTKLVASEHDVTFVGYYRKMLYYKGIKKLIWKQKYFHEKKLEIRNLKLCDLILPHNSDNKTVLIDEGLTDSKIQGLVPFYTDMTSISRNSNHKDILFFGAMSRPENSLSALWFIENVLSKLSDLDVRFIILGSNPPEELKKYESDRIHITGYVDSTAPYFSQAMCFVAPLVLGAGIKIKVLEALSSGIPVLTNEIGIEGIPAKNGWEYFLCSKPEEYETLIRRIYNNEIDEKSIEKNAKAFIKDNFSVSSFSVLYKDMVYKLGGNLI